MAEYKLKMTQDEKTTLQNALINMRYSSAVDEILAEKLDALIAQLAYDSNAVRSHGVSRVSGSVSFFRIIKTEPHRAGVFDLRFAVRSHGSSGAGRCFIC